MSDEKVLNKDQLQAIHHKSGPLLIIAGAGTGKTTVVTERIKHLISRGLAKPEEILALTFTEKASREMEERVDQAMPYGYTQMWISTFHSFCDRILRDEALAIGLDTRYKLMTEAESIKLFRDHLFDFDLNYFRPLGNPTKFISGILQHFSRLQDEDVSPEQYLKWAKEQTNPTSPRLRGAGKLQATSSDIKLESAKWLELANAYKTWDRLKAKEAVLDFGDLITKTLELFRKRPNILKNYQNKFKFILVDEFQDTNIAQNELVKLLAGKRQNITTVLDDDQSIYRFRGAAFSNALDFRKSFPKSKLVVLKYNYRSNQEILDSAYQLIQHNNPDRLEVKENIDKKLVSQVDRSTPQNPVSFVHVDRVENEAEEVAKTINELTSKSSKLKVNSYSSYKVSSYAYSDFAILVRANNHAEPFQQALARAGIPYQFLGPGRLFKQPEIIDLISFLKVLYDFDDSTALYRLLSIDHLKIPVRDLVILGNFTRWNNLTLYEACQKIKDSKVSKASQEKIKNILETIEKGIVSSKKQTAGQVLYTFLEESDLLQNLLNPDDPDAEKRAQNISKFFDKLKTYEVDHEDAGVRAVVDWIDLATELGESPLAADTDWTQVNAVNILTVHSAKGLEFPVVFLVNLVSERFPSRERREQIPIPDELIKEELPKGDFHLQEERRLFYVGMTRAMDRLYLTAADFYGEAKRQKKLSPFIFETLGDKALSSKPSSIGSKQLSFIDFNSGVAVDSSRKIIDRQKTNIHFLSYSQIETFKLCPLHYKLRYILNIPTPPSAALSYGSSLHDTLNDFYLALQSGEAPSEKLLLDLLEKNWIHIGYHSRVHEQKMLKKGQKTLIKFLKKDFDPKVETISLEQPFTIPLDPPEGKLPLKVGGRIDRIDEISSGIEIVDYKTGSNVPSQRDVDKNDQLTIYTLAATQIKDFPFGRTPEKVKLTLHYIEEGKKLSTVRTKKQLSDAVKEIFKVRKAIEESDFKCSGHFFCQNGCEYSMFCNAT